MAARSPSREIRATVDDRPSLKDLCYHVVPGAAVKWRNLGIQLLDSTGGRIMDILEVNYQDSLECCKRMFQKWLETTPDASWSHVLVALRSPPVEFNHLASQIEQKLQEKPLDSFKQLYYQAKHDLGSEKLQLLKLLIFGPPGAGKSSLLKVLLGEDPDAIRNSTGVCDRKLVQCRIAVAITGHGSTSVWVKIKFDDEIRRLKEKINQKLAERRTLSENVSHNPNHRSTNLKIEDEYFFSQRIQSGNSQNLAFIEVVKQTNALIACYDSGGQPEFFDVMPALTTSPTGYVMVFDMSKDIMTKTIEFYRKGKKCLTENTAHYTNAELMKTALANIQSSASSITSKVGATRVSEFGHLLVVGTHLDKCGDNKEEQDHRVLQIEQTMEDDILRIPMDSTLYITERNHKSTKLVHPISNTVKDGRKDVAQEIRTAIENMSEIGRTSEDIPISWLLFQLEIRHNEKYYISHQRCIKIAEDCYIKKEDVNDILKYFHELGILLYYSHIPALQHVVFCDPQWLFDKLTKLIELKYDPPREIKQKLFKGIFSKNMLSKVYRPDFAPNDILSYEHLLELFVSLNIMAILPDETDQYFMPALLNPAPGDIDECLERCYGNKIYDSLFIKFDKRYFPRGVFCCLVAECMKNHATGWSIQYNKAVYKDLIIFQISNNQFIFLRDKIDSIAVEMYHRSDMILSTNADIVCEKLYNSLQTVCKKMQIKDDFKIGFACRCKLIDGTLCNGFAGVKNRLPFHTELRCEKCNEEQKMEREQVCWLISVDFLKEMGESLPRQHRRQHGTNRPTLLQLNDHVRRQATIHWEDLGIILLNVDLIDIIKRNDSGYVEACCTNMFKTWLNSDTEASWSKLVTALKAPSVGLLVLADEIERKFIVGSEDISGLSSRRSDDATADYQRESTHRMCSPQGRHQSDGSHHHSRQQVSHTSENPDQRGSQQMYHWMNQCCII